MVETKKIEKPTAFFHFGENWTNYLDKHFNEELFNEALEITKNFCGEESFKDKTFIDIGCGSGLFSLVAYKLGAKKILSLDIDENSVACCKRLKQSIGNPSHWDIVHASILDDNFISTLGKFDFVYSWGVLHHTGQMWKAIKNASNLVADQGYFCIAIYNKSEGLNIYPDFRFGNSQFWLLEKKIYINLPRFVQTLINWCVMAILIFAYLITFNNPGKKIKEHKSFRGMSWKTDIIDWLGGYPYEFASTEEIFKFLKPLGFNLENLKCNNGLLNNEFLFKKVN
jgi:SAM-dependent methyltransferase